MTDTPLIPELYLILDPDQSANPCNDFEQVRQTAPIISVLIKTLPPQTIDPNLIKTIQSHNIAVLLEDTNKVKDLGADGAHVNSEEDAPYITAQQQLGGDHIIGINPKTSRHTAMHLAEKGASYVALEKFADEDQDDGKDPHKQPPTIAWWVSLFETPCIAWNITAQDQAITAQSAGADFIALAPSFWQQGPNTASIIQKLQTALTENAAAEHETT